MATISWRSGSGVWSDENNWFTLQTPGTGDLALLAGTGPYVSTVDVAFTVNDVSVASAGVTLDIASTLTVATSVLVATSAEVDLAGVFAAGGTLDLSGGGTLVGDGGTLLGGTMLGAFSTILGTGLITNRGSIGWSSTDAGQIGIANAGFVNANQLVLAPIAQAETNEFVTGFTVQHGNTMGTMGELSWVQELVASATISTPSFVNGGTMGLDGGTLTLAGATFDNTGVIHAVGVSTRMVEPAGTTGNGIVYYGVADSVELGQVTVGPGVATFENAGTILASSVEFQRAMTLGDLGTIVGGLTFDAGLDLAGGTLTAGTVSVGGLVQNGSIGGGGTLTLQAGATLDNVAIDPAETVLTTGIGPVVIVDPASTGAAVTLDSVINELDFRTVATFDGGIVLGAGASSDVIGVFTPGGVTLGPDFTFTDSVTNSLVTFGGSSVLNDGTWTVDGGSVDVVATLDGSGMINVANNAVVQIEALADGATPGVTFGAGIAQVILPGTGAIGAVLAGLQLGDLVDFAAVSSTHDPVGQFGTGAATTVDGTLDLTGASGDTASVAVASAAGGLTFNVVPDGNGGSIVEVACFAAGTRIAAERGEVPVQSLRPGDRLRTLGGRLAPVRWVGWTRLDFARHPAPERAAPLCIRAGAFAPGQPARDLYVSPEHCLLADGALVPALMLANGATIARQDGLPGVTYWHVELDRHDVILAEGLPAESYLDTGNRALFAGQDGVRALHPDFSGLPDAAALAVWAAHGCLPLRLTAPDSRAALHARAATLGWRRDAQAGIEVFADGRAAPWAQGEHGLSVRLPAGARVVRLRSRSFVPAECDPGSGDTRRLGLAVAAVCLGGWKLHPQALRSGWHVAAGEAWRWTDGDAEIALPRLVRPGVLALRLHALGRYWQAPERDAAMRAISDPLTLRA